MSLDDGSSGRSFSQVQKPGQCRFPGAVHSHESHSLSPPDGKIQPGKYGIISVGVSQPLGADHIKAASRAFREFYRHPSAPGLGIGSRYLFKRPYAALDKRSLRCLVPETFYECLGPGDLPVLLFAGLLGYIELLRPFLHEFREIARIDPYSPTGEFRRSCRQFVEETPVVRDGQ